MPSLTDKFFLKYLIVINGISIIICIADKLLAIAHKRRISEKSLMILSLLGGATGMYITMLIIRHKTLHKRFMIGLPVIIVLELVALTYLIYSGIINI